MKVMLEEIARKKSEAAQALTEEQTRRDEQGHSIEQGHRNEQGRNDEPMTRRP